MTPQNLPERPTAVTIQASERLMTWMGDCGKNFRSCRTSDAHVTRGTQPTWKITAAGSA